ncbi:Rz1-like lysis system protein LysC [Proteus mirabilis]|uniref:Rz1-like lysis system protein LysC n=1 Tax=Proteus mirabilis TaxID=584 RepID=UPI003EE78BC7
MSHHLIAKSGIGQPWILKKLKRLSKLFLSIMIAPILLFLVTLLSGCTTIQKEYVPVEHIAIPAHLTADCLLPHIPEEMTWGESLMLNILPCYRLLSNVIQTRKQYVKLNNNEPLSN